MCAIYKSDANRDTSTAVRAATMMHAQSASLMMTFKSSQIMILMTTLMTGFWLLRLQQTKKKKKRHNKTCQNKTCFLTYNENLNIRI